LVGRVAPMPYHADFPDDPLLREIAEMLDRSLSVAEVCADVKARRDAGSLAVRSIGW
jgi:hypothetical protein